MKIFLRITSYALTLLIGAVLFFVLQQTQLPRVSTDWVDIAKEKSIGKYTLSMDVLMSDLPIPPIKSLQGRAKFIDHDSSPNVRLGYKIFITTGDIDKSKIPAKYLVEKPIDLGDGKTITQLPLRETNHEAHFTFILKDKDGFILLELQSEEHNLQSAKSTSYQGIASSPVPRSIASSTREITYQLNIDKCTVCE